MRNKRKKLGYIFLVFSLVLLLMACSNASQESEIEIKEFEALTEIVEGQPNIYLIVKALDNNYWDVVTNSIKEAAVQNGCNLYYSGSRVEAEVETQMELLNRVKASDADAVIIAPDDSVKLSAQISELYESGLPVILVDTTVTTENYNVCYMTDNLLAGQQAAEEMLRLLREQNISEQESVSIGIQVGSGISQTINERLAGFCQYWSKNAPEKWIIIDDIKINNGDVGYAEELGYELMNTYPDLKGVFGCNNGSTRGLCIAIQKQQRKDICVVGFDYSDEVAKLIQDDSYSASTMVQRQYLMGQFSVEAAVAILNGEEKKEKFVDTGVLTVTKQNIESEEIQEILRKQ